MLDAKVETLLMVAQTQNYTKAAQRLSLTQPAVSHHMRQLEEELGAALVTRRNGQISWTPEGEIALKYARRMKALQQRMLSELHDTERHLRRIRIGITATAESNLITEVLATYSAENAGVVITIWTDTIKNLYEAMENYELDLAVVERRPYSSTLSFVTLDTDYLVCVLDKENPLAQKAMVTLEDLKAQRMILRLPSSATRIQFETHLQSVNEMIENFDVALEVDNVATIKDLVRKGLGVSILARSACMDEVRKGKLIVLPIENLSMVRENCIAYHRDFSHIDVLNDIVRRYQMMCGGQ